MGRVSTVRRPPDFIGSGLFVLIVGGLIAGATVWRTQIEDLLNGTTTRDLAGCEYRIADDAVDIIDSDAGQVASAEIKIRCEQRPERLRLRIAIEQDGGPTGDWHTAHDAASGRLHALAEDTFDRERSQVPGAEWRDYSLIADCDSLDPMRFTYSIKITRNGHTQSTGPHHSAPSSIRGHYC